MLDQLIAQDLGAYLAFALEITGPILIVLIFGYFFRRINLIDEHFIASGNKLVYNLSLPCLLGFSTVNSPLRESLDTNLVVFGSIATFLIVILSSIVTRFFVSSEKRGVFIQGRAIIRPTQRKIYQ